MVMTKSKNAMFENCIQVHRDIYKNANELNPKPKAFLLQACSPKGNRDLGEPHHGFERVNNSLDYIHDLVDRPLSEQREEKDIFVQKVKWLEYFLMYCYLDKFENINKNNGALQRGGEDSVYAMFTLLYDENYKADNIESIIMDTANVIAKCAIDTSGFDRAWDYIHEKLLSMNKINVDPDPDKADYEDKVYNTLIHQLQTLRKHMSELDFTDSDSDIKEVIKDIEVVVTKTINVTPTENDQKKIENVRTFIQGLETNIEQKKGLELEQWKHFYKLFSEMAELGRHVHRETEDSLKRRVIKSDGSNALDLAEKLVIISQGSDNQTTSVMAMMAHNGDLATRTRLMDILKKYLGVREEKRTPSTRTEQPGTTTNNWIVFPILTVIIASIVAFAWYFVERGSSEKFQFADDQRLVYLP